jgi:hypothetical protein
MPAWSRVLILVALVAGAAAWWFARPPSLPKDHRLSRAGRFAASRDAAWAAVDRIDADASWRTDLRARERQPDVRGHRVWRETWPDDESVTFETVERVGDRKLVRCVVDQGGPFGGCWTLEVAPRGEESVVTVSEQLTIHDGLYARTHDVADRRERLDGALIALGEALGGAPRLADSAKDLRDAAPAP